jgi:hypothetical protein
MDEKTNLTLEQALELGLEPAKNAEEETFEVLPLIEEPPNPSKTGNKPKKLVAMEVYGYEVGRGLKKRVVVPRDVYELASLGATDREIARWFDINEETLRYNFKDIVAKGREELKNSLRRAQLKLALSGNAVMLIWLGKNILGQSDNPYTNDANEPLPWTDTD